MVTTVTLNPCIDRTVEIEKFVYGGTNKVVETRNDVSGKGINVNIVLQHLGVENTAIGFDYEENSERLNRFFKELGCRYSLVKVKGSLRINIKIFDLSASVMSEFNEGGGRVQTEDVARFIETVGKQLEQSSILVVSGSVPPGVPMDIYERVIHQAKEKGVKTILDASGELLKRGIKAKPFLIKPNEEELSATYQVTLETIDDIVEAARKVICDGVEYVCVSRGGKGAVFVSRDHVYTAEPMQVQIKGIQGAGDSMVAGFCYAIEHGMDEEAIFRYGVACATGSLTHPGTQLCMKEDMDELVPLIQIHKIK